MIYNPALDQVISAVVSDFISIRDDGEYLIIIDQSTQLAVARVHYTRFEVIEND